MLARWLGGLDAWAPLALRLALGLVFLGHGAQKLLGLFGGGAIILVHGQHGFFLKDRGIEYTLTLLSMSVALMLTGGGRASVERLLGRRRQVRGASGPAP